MSILLQWGVHILDQQDMENEYNREGICCLKPRYPIHTLALIDSHMHSYRPHIDSFHFEV